MKNNYLTLLENLFEGVFYIDQTKKIKYWSKGAELITGYLSSEIVGKAHCQDILAHTSLDGVLLCNKGCLTRNTLATGSFFKTEVFIKHKEGHRVHIALHITPIHDNQGKIVGATHIFTNNEAFFSIKTQEIEKYHKTLYDSDTQLPNKNNLKMILQAKIEEYNRYNWTSSVYLMEIDDFERIKGVYDKKTRIEIISEVSKILLSGIRPFDTLGRIGENQFLAILINVHNKKTDLLGKRFITNMANSPISVGLGELHLTLSIGATVNQSADTPESILSRAEMHLNHSKSEGGNRLTSKL